MMHNLRIIAATECRRTAVAKSQWSFQSATSLSAALAARKVSAVELARDAIARIERHDEKINAICVRDFERGLQAAREADAALARGEKKPLLGLPLTVKESYNIAGLPTTWGIPQLKNFVANEDALAVTRVKEAGGVVLGKTNVPFGLADWQSYNDIYGITRNPYDLGRTPGGSSGGSSAALAAGYGPLSLGSRRRRLPPATGRCRSAPTSAAPCACRRFTAASTRTSRPSPSPQAAATLLRRLRPCRIHAISP